MIAPFSRQLLRPRLHRSHAIAMLFAASLISAAGITTILDEIWTHTTATARRPLIIDSGVTKQLPTTDYLSTVGGLTTNATASTGSGDLQTTTAEVSSNATVGGTLSVGAINFGVIAPAALGSSTNDWAPTGIQTAAIVQISASAQINLTGIVAPTGFVGGRHLCLENVGSNTISLVHQSASSIAANRLAMDQGATWQFAGVSAGIPGNTICFFYDSAASRWTQYQANLYLPKLNAGSSGQFSVATSGAIASTTAALSGFANTQSATSAAFSVGNAATFTTATTAMTSYGADISVTTTRSSGTGVLTNIGARLSASNGQVNDALATDAGDVLLNRTSGVVGIGATPQIISTGTPTANHGSLGTGSTNWIGNITGIGANTSVTLTYSAAFPNRSWCFATPNSVTAPEDIYVTNSASAPVFNCINTTTGAAANCNDFSYQCVGQ